MVEITLHDTEDGGTAKIRCEGAYILAHGAQDETGKQRGMQEVWRRLNVMNVASMIASTSRGEDVIKMAEMIMQLKGSEEFGDMFDEYEEPSSKGFDDEDDDQEDE